MKPGNGSGPEKYGKARISLKSVLFPLPLRPVMIRWRFPPIGTGDAESGFNLFPGASTSGIFRKDLRIELAAALDAGVAIGFVVM